MKNIWCFGGSMSQSYDSKAKWFKNYVEWKGMQFKTYPELLSENLDCNLFNLSQNSNNNISILQSICDNLHKIESNSLVVIHWTPYSRFRLVNDFEEWQNITVYKNEFLHLSNVRETTINEILINRMHIKYEEEVQSWEKLISQSLNNSSIIFLLPDINPFNKSLIKMHTSGLIGYKTNEVQVERIIDDTCGAIKDGHFSVNGHIQMNQIILSLLNKIKKNIL